MRRQRVRGWVVALGLLVLGGSRACGQDDSEALRLEGLFVSGARISATEAWVSLQFTVENRSEMAKLARVVVFYPSQPDLQFVRDLWVPAHTRRTSWLSLGPAPEQPRELSRDIAYQLFDRTDGTNREVHRRDPERLLTRGVVYARREPTTALYLDSVLMADDPDPLDDPDSADSESLRLMQTFRETRRLSGRVSVIRERYLPPNAEAFDGIDHFVIAGNRLASDPVGRRALRHWVLTGGTLWVLLDRVDPDVIAPILGDGLRFQTVGRTTLTTLRLRAPKQDRSQSEMQDFDRPVELVQVDLSGSETVLFEVNDWPAAFSQSVGHGRVIFTTLGARGWYRPRTPRDPPSRFEHLPDLPVATAAFVQLPWYIQPDTKPAELPVDDLAPLLRAEVGYEVVGRRTAGIILVVFLAVLVLVVLALRQSRAPEIIGLGAPVVAVAATAAFVIVGTSSRNAVPSTAAAVGIVSVSPENSEQRWRGLFAVYNPVSGAVQLSAQHGGLVDFDQSGLEGTTRRRVETDIDTWHWENLSFPAGVRVGPFQSTGKTDVLAVARFGTTGLDGHLTTGAFRDPSDAVLQTRTGALLAVQLNADGSFHVDSSAVLPPNQYLPGTVLTDRQQRRQDLYRRFFAESKPDEPPERDRLFVWAETNELPFVVPGAARTVGAALLIVPLQYENTDAGSLTIPAGFMQLTAVVDGQSVLPTLERSGPTRMRLRFQVPEWVRPFTIERAVFHIRVRAPARRFTVLGVTEGQPVPLLEQLAPVGPLRVEITDTKLLKTDPAGGLFLEMVVSERIGPDGKEHPMKLKDELLMWKIEDLSLEVAGHGAGK
jgi:hypothetical protein